LNYEATGFKLIIVIPNQREVSTISPLCHGSYLLEKSFQLL